MFFAVVIDQKYIYKDSYPSQTPVLRWYKTGIIVAGMTNVSGLALDLLNLPFDMTIDWSYTIYTTDLQNNRVQRFLRGEINGTTVAGQANV